MPTELKILEDTPERTEFVQDFDGHPMHVIFDKATQEFYVNGDDLAKCLGYKDQHDMLSSDAGLDAMNEFKKENPGKPFLSEGIFGPA